MNDTDIAMTGHSLSASRCRLWLPLASILLGLTAAGCSAQATGTGSRSDDGSKGIALSQCMRNNGIINFPDPDASGQLTIDAIANTSSIDVSSPGFQSALSECRALQPAGFTGHQRSADQQAAALGFARCMRDNGVRDFPDPGPRDPLIDTTKIPSADSTGGMDRLHAAMNACREAARGAGVRP